MDRKEFLEQRQKGIGGSDVAPILGLSKWSTPLDVYFSKVDPVKVEEKVPDHLHFGNVLESVVADEFERRTGIKVQRRNQMFRDSKEPCLVANIDRYCVGERAVLECKTVNAFAKGDWGESGTDEVPEAYILQCLHYMAVTGYHKCFLAVLIGGNEFRWYVVPWRQSLANYAREKCVAFWRDYVEPRTPPPPVNTDDLLALYGAGGLSPIEANDEILNTIYVLQVAKASEKGAKERRAELELEIKKYLGEHDALVDPGTGDILATFKASTSRRIDTKELKQVEPDIYKLYSKESTTRRFLLK